MTENILRLLLFVGLRSGADKNATYISRQERKVAVLHLSENMRLLQIAITLRTYKKAKS